MRMSWRSSAFAKLSMLPASQPAGCRQAPTMRFSSKFSANSGTGHEPSSDHHERFASRSDWVPDGAGPRAQDVTPVTFHTHFSLVFGGFGIRISHGKR